jgi:hypothetical protein
MIACVFSFLAGCLAAAPAGAQSIALVTDLSGKVSLAGGTAGGVAILSEIPGNTDLRIEAGARLTVLFFASGEEYQLKGPALARVGAEGLKMLEGEAPLKRTTPYGSGVKGVAIRPAGVAQATFVMRGGRAVAPLKLEVPANITILEAAPEFRWQPIGSGARYRFELLDERGASLHAAESEATALRLPDSVRLREGATYRWDVTARSGDGVRFVGSTSFSVASQELRSQMERLRPAPNAPVSERVTFAVWLEQVALRDEARRYWKALAAERPDEDRLKSKGAEAARR